jgi:hypothetical protein
LYHQTAKIAEVLSGQTRKGWTLATCGDAEKANKIARSQDYEDCNVSNSLGTIEQLVEKRVLNAPQVNLADGGDITERLHGTSEEGLQLGVAIRSIVGDEFNLLSHRLHLKLSLDSGVNSRHKKIGVRLNQKNARNPFAAISASRRSIGTITANVPRGAISTIAAKFSSMARSTTDFSKTSMLGRVSLHQTASKKSTTSANHDEIAANLAEELTMKGKVKKKLTKLKHHLTTAKENTMLNELLRSLGDSGTCFTIGGASYRVVDSNHPKQLIGGDYQQLFTYYVDSENFQHDHVGVAYRNGWKEKRVGALGDDEVKVGLLVANVEDKTFRQFVNMEQFVNPNQQPVATWKLEDIEIITSIVPSKGVHVKFLDEESMKIGEGLILPEESPKDVLPSVFHEFVLESICKVLNNPSAESMEQEQKYKPLSIVLVAGSGIYIRPERKDAASPGENSMHSKKAAEEENHRWECMLIC